MCVCVFYLMADGADIEGMKVLVHVNVNACAKKSRPARGLLAVHR